MRAHLYGTFNLTHAVAAHFRAQQTGSLINMTSNSAVIGNRGQANYCAAKLGIVGLSKAMALDMAAFGVRSNCIAPLAWSRMTETVPAKTPEQARHVEKIRRMGPETIAPLVRYLASDASRDVSGRIFAIRLNEIFLMSQSRPVRSVHSSDDWTAQGIAAHGMARTARVVHAAGHFRRCFLVGSCLNIAGQYVPWDSTSAFMTRMVDLGELYWGTSKKVLAVRITPAHANVHGIAHGAGLPEQREDG